MFREVLGQTQLRKDLLKVLGDVGGRERGEEYPDDIQLLIMGGAKKLSSGVGAPRFLPVGYGWRSHR